MTLLPPEVFKLEKGGYESSSNSDGPVERKNVNQGKAKGGGGGRKNHKDDLEASLSLNKENNQKRKQQRARNRRSSLTFFRDTTANNMDAMYHIRHSLKLPKEQNWKSVLVYDQSGGDIPIDTTKFQGVWASKVPQQTTNPQELWLFDDGHEPDNLKGSTQIYGPWGFRPGLSADFTDFKPQDLWILPPLAQIPKNFEVRGVWIYAQVMGKTSSMKPGSSAFVDVCKSVANAPLDVAGTWRVYFHKKEGKKGSSSIAK